MLNSDSSKAVYPRNILIKTTLSHKFKEMNKNATFFELYPRDSSTYRLDPEEV